ncbi:TatD family hydrolase [Bacillus canaveralius]|uniref:TatD family hydrolase n=1 Tax=Bacillus canaveralius TaxID=1403243 RepID=UPI000F79ED12|nr:TatD family hydrolase [Bacillus canaveralius]RSK47913.1 TatD family deoxyribonuclease [Bacillus canaveralius]
MNKIIDAHIHLDQYSDDEIEKFFLDGNSIDKVISVSMNLQSCKRNLELSFRDSRILPAFGYHPEQALPTGRELADLLEWMEKHRNTMVAVGEVGLPFYRRKKDKQGEFPLQQYIELLETFVIHAKRWGKPIILHAVYDDASIVCGLLEKHSIVKAYFHWFKGDAKTLRRIAENGYYISVTPDIVYEKEIQSMVSDFPLGQLMVETDGPWPFEGPFQGIKTHPNMIHASIKIIAQIKNLPEPDVYRRLYINTLKFYSLAF